MSIHLEPHRSTVLLAAGLAALLGAFLVTAGTPVVLLAVAAFVVVVLAVFNRVLALYAVALAAAISPEIALRPGLSVHLDELLTAVFAVVWLLRVVADGQRRTSALDKLLIAYVLVGVASILWGINLGTVSMSLFDKERSAPLHLALRLELVFLFMVIVDTLRTADDVKNFTYVMMVALVGLSVVGVSSYLSGESGIALGPAGAPVHEPGWGSLLNCAFAFSLLPAANRTGKIVLGLVIAFSLAVLPLSFGRNFIMSTMFVIAYIGIVQQRWVLAFLPLPPFMWLLYPKVFVERILTLQNLLVFDVSGQKSQGAALISRLIAPGFYTLYSLGYSPLLGFGLGSLPLGDADSEYAIQLYFTGLIGFTIFILMLVCLFRMIIETKRKAQNPMQVALANAYQLLLLAFVFFSVLSASVSSQRAGTFFFIIAAMIAALHRAVTMVEAEEPARAAAQLRRLRHAAYG